MENTDENSQGEQAGQQRVLTPEEKLKIFKFVKELTAGVEGTAGMDNIGRMDSMQTEELVKAMESLELGSAEVGDVVWWLTNNSSNYLKVSEIGDETKGPSGSFQSFRNDGNPGRAYEKAYLSGSGIQGGLLVKGVLKQGFPVEMVIPSIDQDMPPKHYWSSPTQDIGIIKSETITPNP